ncbi:GIY-YIG nuclease family protein [Lysinibacillus endophyticus]|uniref:GIY-YIG nuclease family protein n=1 Tax=Ureibacillus endophyticus TaxID=1978490 RepID=A0A494YVW0_9BACL|nr:GIY-YIG nuclease family protein [Lysinibacillus endophyticus]RKQ13841.1 GIY-YIG nuclease family protein [Lysinibacillus endophyticus]
METNNKHIFYVLECKDNTLYAGYTNNLDKRVATHNAGKGAKYTKARRPVKCIYYETYETKQEAMRAEYAFKQLKRSEKLKYIGGNNEITKK